MKETMSVHGLNQDARGIPFHIKRQIARRLRERDAAAKLAQNSVEQDDAK